VAVCYWAGRCYYQVIQNNFYHHLKQGKSHEKAKNGHRIFFFKSVQIHVSEEHATTEGYYFQTEWFFNNSKNVENTKEHLQEISKKSFYDSFLQNGVSLFRIV
jgi:hypothetical protein